MKKVFLCMSAMVMIVSFGIAHAKDKKMQNFVNAIKKNDATKVKNSFVALKKKNETNAELRARIVEYYKKESQNKKSDIASMNTPTQQAVAGDGERGGSMWKNSLEALRDLGFPAAKKALEDAGY